MVSFFKSNNPSVVIFYIFYLVLFRIAFAFIPVYSGFVFEHREPLSKILFAFLKNISQNYLLLSLILSAILCFLQSLFINQVVNDNKILSRKSYIGGLLFIIFSSFFKESILLSPASIAITFLLLCTGKIFGLFKKEKATSDIFDIGFLVGVASLFYFPSVIFIIFAYIGVASLRPFVYREWLIVWLGFLSPLIMIFTYYFWNDYTGFLFSDLLSRHNSGWLQPTVMSYVDWALIGSIFMVGLGLLVMLPSALYSSLIQVRKFSTLLVLFIVFTGVSFALQQQISLSHFVFLAVPLSIIACLVLAQIKSKLVSEVIHIILILLVLAGQFLPLFNLF